jgi:hypothetical protein
MCLNFLIRLADEPRMKNSRTKTARLALLLALFGLAGCSTPSTPAAQSAIRNYSGTASVGDFLTISINSTTLTITYKNYSNGDTGTVPYTVNTNGTYAITDPNGNLVAAYEVPGSVLLVETNKSGPSHNTPALITAIESEPASISTFAGQSFNYMQFRTSSGGMGFGTITVDAQGNIQHDAYWPYGALQQPQDLFEGGTFAASSIQEDASGDFFTIAEGNGSVSTAFGTQNGFFAVDTANGTILGLPKASSRIFSSSHAGTYTAIFYEKPNAQMEETGESGTPVQGTASVTIGATGLMTITDSRNNILASGTLTAVADTPYLYDGKGDMLSDPCYGMFTFRTLTANSQQDVFVSFQGNAVIFAGFQTGLPIQAGATYTYFYGVGVS